MHLPQNCNDQTNKRGWKKPNGMKFRWQHSAGIELRDQLSLAAPKAPDRYVPADNFFRVDNCRSVQLPSSTSWRARDTQGVVSDWIWSRKQNCLDKHKYPPFINCTDCCCTGSTIATRSHWLSDAPNIPEPIRQTCSLSHSHAFKHGASLTDGATYLIIFYLFLSFAKETR